MDIEEELLKRFGPCAIQEKIKEDDCARKGLCCACVAWHRDHGKKPLPYCLRDLDGVTWTPRQ